MRHPWFYLTLSALFTVSFLLPLEASSGAGEKAAVHVPMLAASHAKVMIQVSSFRGRQEAESEAARLKASGVDARIRHESVQGKGKWYRVYAGQFDTKSQARKYALSLKEKGVITWFWVKAIRAPSAFSSAPTTSQDEKGGSPPTGTGHQSPGHNSAVKSNVASEQGVAPKSSALQNSKLPLPEKERQPALSAKAVAPTVAASSKSPVKQELAEEEKETHRPETGALINWGVRFKSQTTLRAFERDTTKGQDTLVAPLYQYLQLDFGDAEAGGWTMHFNGWGRYDLADSAHFKNSAEGELLYGYLEYSKPYSALRLALGRQQIFAGAINETVDGLQISAGVGESFSTTVFGGVTAGSTESSSDLTYGGRFAVHPQPHYEFAVSYQDTDLEGLPDQRVGGDLAFNWSDWLTVQGISSYNLDSEDWREHNYSAALRYKDFTVEPAYLFFNYADYFGNGKEKNNLFNFLKDTQEQVTIVGGNIQYQGDTPVRFAGRYNQYTYDVRQEDAAYYAALVTLDLPDGSQLGGEAGRMDGETVDNIYNLYRAYFYWANPFRFGSTAFVSGDAIFQDYDAPVFGEDSATHYSLSGGMHFFDDMLEVRLTGLYSQDPYFDENVEGLLTFRVNY